MSRRWMTLAVAMAMASLSSCGGDGPSAPTGPSVSLVSISPVSALTWGFDTELPNPKINPDVLWTVRFKAPKTGELVANVRLLNSKGATCFRSSTGLAATVDRWYTVHGGERWALDMDSPPYRNSCGEVFTVAAVDVNIVEGHVGNYKTLLGIQSPLSMSFSKVGPTYVPPEATGKTCRGRPAPESVSCGAPTAKCNDETWSCSEERAGTCSPNNGVWCWVCPGPLC